MSRTMHLHSGEVQDFDGDRRHRCVVERRDGENVVSQEELWVQFQDPPVIEPDELASFLMLVLLTAMQERRDLVVHGQVPGSLLANLEEFHDAWRLIDPPLQPRFQPIAIEVGEVVDDSDRRPLPGAVTTSSGGYDAAFTLRSHVEGWNGRRGLDIRRVIMIDGMELYDRPADFTRAAADNTAIVSSLGLELTFVSCNHRFLVGACHIMQNYGAMLAAIQRYYRQEAGTGLIASGHHYSAARDWLPLGSNPMTDHLLSSADFAIRHDGAGSTRLEKMQALADWPELNRHVRVCWQDDSTGGNCGHCEKCLRMMLIHQLLAGEIPPAYPAGVDLRREIYEIDVWSSCRVYWRELADWIETTGRGREWLGLVLTKGWVREPLLQLANKAFGQLMGT